MKYLEKPEEKNLKINIKRELEVQKPGNRGKKMFQKDKKPGFSSLDCILCAEESL